MKQASRTAAVILVGVCWLGLAPAAATADEKLWLKHMNAGRAASEKGDGETLLKELRLALNEAESFAEDDERLVGTLDLLASAHLMVKEDAAASEPLQKRALAIREKAWGPKSPKLTESLSVLAMTEAVLGDLRQANELCRRSLAIQTEDPSPDPHIAAWNLAMVAKLCLNGGDCAQDARTYARFVGVLEQRGRTDPEVGVMLENYAELLRAGGQEAEAKKVDARARAIKAMTAEKAPRK
jgi:hypothetical protein